MNHLYLKSWILFVTLFAGCTTQRPLYLDTPSKKDTVMMRPIVINNETKVKDSVKWVHDTLVIREITRMPAEKYLDTTLLAAYFGDRFFQNEVTISEMRDMLIAMQLLMTKKQRGSDSQRVVLQQKLDTSSRANVMAQREIAATKVILYDLPVYILLVFIALILVIGIVLQYLKRRLRQKKARLQKTDASAT